MGVVKDIIRLLQDLWRQLLEDDEAIYVPSDTHKYFFFQNIF